MQTNILLINLEPVLFGRTTEEKERESERETEKEVKMVRVIQANMVERKQTKSSCSCVCVQCVS